MMKKSFNKHKPSSRKERMIYLRNCAELRSKNHIIALNTFRSIQKIMREI